MTLRIVAVILAGGLLLTAAGADERKKTPASPATEVKPIAPPAKQVEPPMTLPSSHYLDGHNPQYFPEKPGFPVICDLEYQVQLSGIKYLKARQVVKTFAVADLVVPMPLAGTAGKPLTEKPKTLEVELIKKIITNVEPASWNALGGEGTIEYSPIGMALVVNQTPEIQAAVEKMLDAMRQMQDQQVLTELRIVTVSDDWFAKSELKAMVGGDGKKAAAKKVVMLNCDEATKLLRAAQKDAATMVLSAPRLVTLNGQPGVMLTGQTEHYVTELKSTVVNGQVVTVPKNEPQFLGLEVKLEPNVSACGKYIRLSVEGSSRELGITPVAMLPVATNIQPLPEVGRAREEVKFTQYIQDPKIITRAIAGTIVLPDGGMALLYGGKATIEETVKEQAPMLADVPVLAELFTKERKATKTNHLLVVVHSRVVKPDMTSDECENCCKSGDTKLTKLLGEYSRACKTGKAEDARRLAMECLVIDPTCFGKK